MALVNIEKKTVTNAGLAYSVDAALLPDYIYVTLSNTLVLVADVSFSITGTPANGQAVTVVVNGGNGSIDLNGNSFTINGTPITQTQLQAGLIYYCVSDGTDWMVPIIINSQDSTSPAQALDASFLTDHSITLAKLAGGAAGRVMMAAGVNGYISLIQITGDLAIADGGVATIANSAVTNAKIDAAAAIARTKLANGTANHVLINDGSGVMSSEATLAKSRGGLGQSIAASTGFFKISAGTLDISAIPETIAIPVSFESGEQAQNQVKMSFSGTVVEVFATCIKAIAGTDDATITAKNGAGTNMTGGVVTFTASDPLNTAYAVTPSANNTFVAGDVLQFVTAKSTAGGKALVSIKVTRNN